MIIGVLLITNLTVALFFYNHKCTVETPKTPGFSERLKQEVGFTPDQMKVLEPRKKLFSQTMHEHFEKLKNTKERFYYQMYDASIPDSLIEARADSIGNEQKRIDLLVIRHFKDIRMLCTDEQRPKFDSLLPFIIHRMTAPPGKK